MCLPLAFLVAVELESVLTNLLSLVHGVSRGGLLASHGVVLVGWGVWVSIGPSRDALLAPLRLARSFAKAIARSPLGWLLVPLVAILALVALRYPPNNYDSLSYRLPRVVHWLDHRSDRKSTRLNSSHG